jgi:hypothetical protein
VPIQDHPKQLDGVKLALRMTFTSFFFFKHEASSEKDRRSHGKDVLKFKETQVYIVDFYGVISLP